MEIGSIAVDINMSSISFYFCHFDAFIAKNGLFDPRLDPLMVPFCQKCQFFNFILMHIIQEGFFTNICSTTYNLTTF